MDGMVIAEWWMGGWVDRWVEGRKHSFLPTKNFRIQAWMMKPWKKLSGGAEDDCVHDLGGMEEGPKRNWK